MTELTPEQLYRPGLEDVPACKSSISFVDGDVGILDYRGYLIEDLCKVSNFEEVAYLLVFGKLPTRAELTTFDNQLKTARKLSPDTIGTLKSLPKKMHPMTMLQAMIAVIGGNSEIHNLRDDQKNIHDIVNIIAKVPTIIAYFDRYRKGLEFIQPNSELNTASNFLYMLSGKTPDDQIANLFDVCLILHAEQTLNASTFSTRVTASTWNSAYTSVSAGVGTLYGPLHGGANEQVLKMLEKIGSVEAVRHYVEERMAKKEKIMGVGHRVYKTKDPRATVLQELAVKLFKDETQGNVLLNIAFELEKVIFEKMSAKGIYPNVDFYSGIVYNKLAIETDLFTPVFAIARSAGWLAHWYEQIHDNRLFRPEQIFTGVRGLVYKPIDQRS
jgi:citrate synthase